MKAELILTLATLNTPSPSVRLALRKILEKNHTDPKLRQAAIATTIFLKTHDPSLTPHLPQQFQVEDRQWNFFEDFSFFRDRKMLDDLAQGPISDRSLLLEIASLLPPQESYPILQKQKIGDPALIDILFRERPRLTPELLNLIQTATDLSPRAHPARKQLVQILNVY